MYPFSPIHSHSTVVGDPWNRPRQGWRKIVIVDGDDTSRGTYFHHSVLVRGARQLSARAKRPRKYEVRLHTVSNVERKLLDWTRTSF